jgi:hypothetical protein
MTTTVRVLIEGNKECEVQVVNVDGTESPSYTSRNVKPGSFTTVCIHGEQTVLVKEVGEFIS